MHISTARPAVPAFGSTELLAVHVKGQWSDNAFPPLGVLLKYKEIVNLYV
jgi:hypothetical protein